MNKELLDKFAREIQDFYMRKPFNSADEADEAIDEFLELKEEMKENGLYEIGKGRDRITFESRGGDIIPENCIVKFSMSDGTNQNREAIEIWQEMSEEARSCVAPLIDWNEYDWIIQEQASHTAKGTHKVKENLEDAGWVCGRELRSENIGDLNGKKVLIDLGIGLRPK